MRIGHMMMAKRHLLMLTTLVILFFVGDRFTGAQDDSTNIRVNVDLVQLNVAVTDSKGNYVSGLGPENFAITEDKIPERLATFEESNEGPRQGVPSSPNAPGGKIPAPVKSTPKIVAPMVASNMMDKGYSAPSSDGTPSMQSQISGAN